MDRETKIINGGGHPGINYSPLTLQDYFNNAAWWAFGLHHGAAFKRLGIKDSVSCLYLTEGGNCCLIGCSMIKPPAFCMQLADGALERVSLPAPNGVNQLQRLHDQLCEEGRTHPLLYFPLLKASMVEFAEEWGLKVPEVLQCP